MNTRLKLLGINTMEVTEKAKLSKIGDLLFFIMIFKIIRRINLILGKELNTKWAELKNGLFKSKNFNYANNSFIKS
jgi:hypothetical protein